MHSVVSLVFVPVCGVQMPRCATTESHPISLPPSRRSSAHFARFGTDKIWSESCCYFVVDDAMLGARRKHTHTHTKTNHCRGNWFRRGRGHNPAVVSVAFTQLEIVTDYVIGPVIKAGRRRRLVKEGACPALLSDMCSRRMCIIAPSGPASIGRFLTRA